MDILVISDSHGHGDRIQELLDRRPIAADAVFFLGDGLRDLAWIETNVPIYKVRGNCDFYNDGTESEILTELYGKRIFAAHGHAYSVKSTLNIMIKRAIELDADIMLYGHTHTPQIKTYGVGDSVGGVTLKKPLHILNPGSIGSYGASYGLVVIRGKDILLSVSEL